MEIVINLDGPDQSFANKLTNVAERYGMEVDDFALYLLRLGLTVLREEPQQLPFHELDALAGTWSVEEAANFEAATSHFELIDEKLWP